VICSHQYLAELEDQLREAIFGLVPSTVAFRLGPTDAERLGKVLYGEFPVKPSRAAAGYVRVQPSSHRQSGAQFAPNLT
jgi:hypothetical protein